MLEYYRGMLSAWADAEPGQGAVRYRGDHIDAAHVATARSVVELSERLTR